MFVIVFYGKTLIWMGQIISEKFYKIYKTKNFELLKVKTTRTDKGRILLTAAAAWPPGSCWLTWNVGPTTVTAWVRHQLAPAGLAVNRYIENLTVWWLYNMNPCLPNYGLSIGFDTLHLSQHWIIQYLTKISALGCVQTCLGLFCFKPKIFSSFTPTRPSALCSVWVEEIIQKCPFQPH